MVDISQLLVSFVILLVDFLFGAAICRPVAEHASPRTAQVVDIFCSLLDPSCTWFIFSCCKEHILRSTFTSLYLKSSSSCNSWALKASYLNFYSNCWFGANADPFTLRYGKYCGIGYTGCAGEAPCDGIDQCCLTHDHCIGSSLREWLQFCLIFHFIKMKGISLKDQICILICFVARNSFWFVV